MLFVSIMLGWVLIPSQYYIHSDYVKKITVDSSDKIEQALSNAVDSVTSRNFIVTRISVKYRQGGKKFSIECHGIETGNLLKY